MIKTILTFLISVVLLSQISRAQVINPPSNLEAEPENLSYIKVKWDDNSNNEEGFYIERSLTNGKTGWETIGSSGPDIRIFNDYWVTNNVTYYYRAYAYSGTMRSDYSNTAFTTAIIDTTALPGAPTDLIVTGTTPTSIAMSWTDNSDNESGFIIARRRPDEILFTYIDTVGADILTYQEVGLTPDNLFYYKVCAYNGSGLSDFTNTVSAKTVKNTSIVSQNSELPDKFFLGNNFPNPFNPTTNIKFGITSSSFVSLRIYNMAGIEVDQPLHQNFHAGTYQITWSGDKFSSGVYFYKLETEDFASIKKMILIK